MFRLLQINHCIAFQKFPRNHVMTNRKLNLDEGMSCADKHTMYMHTFEKDNNATRKLTAEGQTSGSKCSNVPKAKCIIMVRGVATDFQLLMLSPNLLKSQSLIMVGGWWEGGNTPPNSTSNFQNQVQS